MTQIIAERRGTDLVHAARGAAALGAAMGIGRFAFTPILPMMTAGASLSAQAGATLATANYVGYLAGALAATASPRMARSPFVLRASLVGVVATLLWMPLLDSPIQWAGARLLAGFASALVFIGAVNAVMDRLRHHAPHLAGWGFGGIGVGIAASGLLVLVLPPAADWRCAWWAVGVLAAVLAGGSWARHRHPSAGDDVPVRRRNPTKRWFGALLTAGYSAGQIAGPLLVAPLMKHGFDAVLITGAAVVACAAAVAGVMRLGYPASGTDRAA